MHDEPLKLARAARWIYSWGDGGAMSWSRFAIWARRFAIWIFVVLPMILAFVDTSLRLIIDPFWTPSEHQVAIWLFVILPFDSAVSYGLGIHAERRGQSRSGYAKAGAWFVIVPSVLAIYCIMCLLVLIAMHGGRWMTWM